MNQPVSVVIPVYNGEKTIAQTLRALRAQDYAGPVEIIVVDDGSSDNTPSIIAAVTGIRSVRQENAGPAAARNRGADLATAQIVFFTDADCVPELQWISTMRAHLNNPAVAAVMGSYACANSDNRIARCIQHEIEFRHKRMPRYCKVFGSYNFCIRKDVFKKLGGFNSEYRHASGEDNDLSYKITKAGYAIYFEPEAKVKHYHSTSFRQYLPEQFRHGFWRVKMYRDHPAMCRGDDYTFWKDILETGVTGGIFLSILLALVRAPFAAQGAVLLAVALLAFEGIAAFIISKSISDTFILLWLMYIRAYVRTIGFLSGIPHFFLQKPLKIS